MSDKFKLQILDASKLYNINLATRSDAFVGADSKSSLILTTVDQALDLYVTISTHDATKQNICGLAESGKFCLDQFGNNVTQACYSSAGYYSGQELTLTSLLQYNGDTYWRIQSVFGGDRMLSAQDNNVLMIYNATAPNVYWKFVEASSKSSNASSTATATATAGAGTATSSVDAASASTTSATSNSPSSSNSAPVGIIAGAVVAAVLIIIFGIGLVCFFHRRSKKKRQSRLVPPQPPQQQPLLDEKNTIPRKPVTTYRVSEVPADPPFHRIFEIDGKIKITELAGDHKI